MACEFLAVNRQNVNNDSVVNFTASIPCRKGYVVHEDETGIFILRGITNGQCYATYQVVFNANIGVPTGGTIPTGGVAVGLAVNGEVRPSSIAIAVPATAGTDLVNVTSTAIIRVPKGCCFSLAVEATSASTDPTVTPAPVIAVQNANLVINRIA